MASTHAATAAWVHACNHGAWDSSSSRQQSGKTPTAVAACQAQWRGGAHCRQGAALNSGMRTGELPSSPQLCVFSHAYIAAPCHRCTPAQHAQHVLSKQAACWVRTAANCGGPSGAPSWTSPTTSVGCPYFLHCVAQPRPSDQPPAAPCWICLPQCLHSLVPAREDANPTRMLTRAAVGCPWRRRPGRAGGTRQRCSAVVLQHL